MSLAETEDNSPPPSPEEIYQAFRRSLQRRKGFGILFVECSPAQGERLIKQIQRDLPQKQIEVLNFDQPVPNGNLYQQVEDFLDQKEQVNILFIQGLEYSLYDYEETKRHLGWSSQDIYSYSWKGVPPILTNLNQQRERFRDNFNTCLVFLAPPFVIKYFIHRAPDFFDWRSGIFEFPMDVDLLKQESWRIYFNDSKLEEYEALNPQECRAKILELQALIDETYQNDDGKVNLLSEQALLLKLLNKYEDAVICYDKAIKIKPDKHNIWYNRGTILSNLGQKQAAIDSYDKAIEFKPDDHEAWYNRGTALSILEQYEEAIDSYDKALELKPDFYQAWSNRGKALDSLGRHEEALQSYDKALKIEPNSVAIWIHQGNSLNTLKRYEEAVASYDKALSFDLDSYKVWSNKGNVLRDLKRYKDAIASYNRALALKPDSSVIWYSRASTLYDLEQYEEALDNCDRAIKLDSRDDTTWILRGIILAALGQYKEADESYNHIQKSNWSFLGNDLYNFGCYNEAVRIYEYALQSDPDDDIAWYFNGLALYKLKSHKEAVESFDKFLELSPYEVSASYVKACCCALLGEVDRAIENLQQAVRVQEYRERAKTDTDFDAIRSDDRFQSLISDGE